MAISLFQRTNFRGNSAQISRDQNDLRDIPVGRNVSSMTMTRASDEILLYKKRNWRGGVMFRRGRQSINNLGSPRSGGRNTFRNNIASVRVTPFFLNLNVTIVGQSDGTLPGGAADIGSVGRDIGFAVRLINQFYVREQALLELSIAQTNLRVNNRKFNLSMAETASFPASWKNRDEVDVIVVNSFDNNSFGLAKLPWWGKVCIVAATSGGVRRSRSQLAKTLAHEIGHFLGSPHVATGTNIMRQGSFNIGTRTATTAQIQEWHTKLSRNLTRRRNRKEG